jgi:hypothetical protein
MTSLEALAILETTTLECREREVDTPEVRDALDLLEPHIRPEWLIPQFRYFLVHERDVQNGKEAQHQVLCTTFPLIRDSVKTLIEVRMDALARKFHETHDLRIKTDIERLAGALSILKKPWVCVPPPTLH